MGRKMGTRKTKTIKRSEGNRGSKCDEKVVRKKKTNNNRKTEEEKTRRIKTERRSNYLTRYTCENNHKTVKINNNYKFVTLMNNKITVLSSYNPTAFKKKIVKFFQFKKK